MFLIEYDKGMFIDGGDIQWISICEGDSRFTVKGDTVIYIVKTEYCATFFNHLQALNGNITNIEGFWHKLNTA